MPKKAESRLLRQPTANRNPARHVPRPGVCCAAGRQIRCIQRRRMSNSPVWACWLRKAWTVKITCYICAHARYVYRLWKLRTATRRAYASLGRGYVKALLGRRRKRCLTPTTTRTWTSPPPVSKREMGQRHRKRVIPQKQEGLYAVNTIRWAALALRAVCAHRADGGRLRSTAG